MSEHGPGPMCAGCGKCCEALPGAYHPDDFGLNMPDALRELFATGNACLDWRDSDKIVYPRPQTIKARGRLINPSFGGQCVHLAVTGCTLPREKMPAECRWLEPRQFPGEDCTSTNGTSKGGIADAWIPYQSLLWLVLNAAEKEKGAGPSRADPDPVW